MHKSKNTLTFEKTLLMETIFNQTKNFYHIEWKCNLTGQYYGGYFEGTEEEKEHQIKKLYNESNQVIGCEQISK